MKWYVLDYDFNEKKLSKCNIFDNSKFNKGVEDLLKNFITYNDFREKLDNELKYAFRFKREYELFVGDAFEENINKYEKVDVYMQVAPNLDILAHYIIETYNNKPYRKKKLENESVQ